MEENRKLSCAARIAGYMWVCGCLFFAAALPVMAYDYGSGLYNSGLYGTGSGDTLSITLASGTNPSAVGDSITLSVTVSPGTATGTLTYKSGATTIGTASFGHGSGSLAVSSLTAGTHSLTAVFAGNARYSPATSNALTQTVTSATVTTSSSSGSGGGGGGGGGRRGVPPADDEPARPAAPSQGSSASSGSDDSLPGIRGYLAVTLPGSSVVTVFRDVPLSSWYSRPVYELLVAGVVSGYRSADGQPLGLYGPANPVTYAEIAKMTLEAGNKTILTTTPANRTARDHWASAYIATAEDLSLSVFKPSLDINKSATRGQVIQTVMEVLGTDLSVSQTHSFTDVSALHPHAAAISAAASLGIISGDTDTTGKPTGTFRPDTSVNRAEVAKIIVAMLKEARP